LSWDDLIVDDFTFERTLGFFGKKFVAIFPRKQRQHARVFEFRRYYHALIMRQVQQLSQPVSAG